MIEINLTKLLELLIFFHIRHLQYPTSLPNNNQQASLHSIVPGASLPYPRCLHKNAASAIGSTNIVMEDIQVKVYEMNLEGRIFVSEYHGI